MAIDATKVKANKRQSASRLDERQPAAVPAAFLRCFEAHLSATKNFHITERIRSQLRVDAFNAFNTPQFGFPASTINTGNPAASVTSITSTVSDNRDLQLALKLQF